MTRTEAFTQAQANRKAYVAADIEFMFGRNNLRPNPRDYGYCGGRMVIGEFSFEDHELLGLPRNCPVQAAFAYL